MLADWLPLLHTHALSILAGTLALVSVALSSRARSSDTFYRGQSAAGVAPDLWTLTLSQVTTWIFARSLLNAAILGFYYGIWGTLAYTAYYLSFLTGGAIVDSLRFRHGFDSVQAFLADRFGRVGTLCYNSVIGLRLISEVFANVLVIGILFGAAGSAEYALAVTLFAGVTLFYSMLGGLHASLKTDVVQMLVFLLVMVILAFFVFDSGLASLDALTFKTFHYADPGPVLLAVALIQVWSYPMHDPVMMDRGFLTDRDTTRKSFLHSTWLGCLCILAFGTLGVFAGAIAAAGESMNQVLERVMGDTAMFFFNAALIISAMSTLDSTLSSSSKLVAVDMKIVAPSLRNGRMTMALFMLLGLGFVYLGNEDLFSAVAVSGTASLYLAPVIFFSLWGGRQDIPLWSYVGSFGLAIAGAVLYFTESSGYSVWMGDTHKYTKLLYITLVVMGGGCLLFWLGTLPGKVRQLIGPGRATA
jgi:Na+/proline symporter